MHCVFETAFAAEPAEVMAEFKARAAAVAASADMGFNQEYLHRKQREIDEKYDYRYSQLLFVCARLLRDRCKQTGR